MFSETYSLEIISKIFGSFGSFGSGKEDSKDYKLDCILFSSSTNSNDGIATVIELVIIYDSDLANDLSKRTAKEYFSMVDQLRYDYRGKLAILEWEIPAKDKIFKPYYLKNLLKKAKPKLMLIFAKMKNKRLAHRYTIAESDTKLRINVEKDKLSLEHLNKKSNGIKNNSKIRKNLPNIQDYENRPLSQYNNIMDNNIKNYYKNRGNQYNNQNYRNQISTEYDKFRTNNFE